MTQPTREPGSEPDVSELITPELLQHLVALGDDEVILPLRVKREKVRNVRAVKLSDQEVVTVAQLQAFLHDRHYLPDNTFASLFVYCFNLTYTQHKQIADAEAEAEVHAP